MPQCVICIYQWINTENGISKGNQMGEKED